MKKRIAKKKETPIEKMLSKHKDHCAYWIYSGDRHCSCGRNDAISEWLSLLKDVSVFVDDEKMSARLEKESSSLERMANL